MKLFSFVMMSSQDAKLSYRVMANLSLVVVVMELSLLVAAGELADVVVAVT
jgi:hypothetical protein